MSSGIGLREFLGRDPDSQKMGGGGGRRDYVDREWKKKGEFIFWLHALASPLPAFVHSFAEEREFEDKETKKTKRYLGFPRFNSPDPERVHANQFFRSKETGILKILTLDRDDEKYTRSFADPFLILREWLRWEVDRKRLSTEEVVFEWQNPKERELIRWEAGHLSGLEKRGERNWSASLDTKNEYVFVVVPEVNPEKPLIFQETQLIGDAIRKVIKEQIESDGDEGDPLGAKPYAFKVKYDADEKSPMKKYTALRYNQAKYRDEIYELINSEEYPDPAEQVKFHRDDLTKIRAAFEAAAQIDLPLDQIFDPDPEVRRLILIGEYDQGRSTKASPRGDTQRQEPQDAPRTGARPPATPGAAKPARGAAPPQGGAQAPAAPGRRLKAPPAEKPVEPETVPCDRCGKQMDPKASVCPHCGAEYEVDGEPEAAPQESPKEEPKKKGAAPPPASKESEPAPEAPKRTGGRKRGGAAPPAEKPAPREPGDDGPEEDAIAAAESRNAPDGTPTKCWACGDPRIKKNEKGVFVCENCGVDQEDAVPFA